MDGYVVYILFFFGFYFLGAKSVRDRTAQAGAPIFKILLYENNTVGGKLWKVGDLKHPGILEGGMQHTEMPD